MGKDIGLRNICKIREVAEGSVSEPEPVMGMREPPAWYSDQQTSQELGQTSGFEYNYPEFRETGQGVSEGIVSD